MRLQVVSTPQRLLQDASRNAGGPRRPRSGRATSRRCASTSSLARRTIAGRPAQLADDLDWILAASGQAESGDNRLPLIGCVREPRARILVDHARPGRHSHQQECAGELDNDPEPIMARALTSRGICPGNNEIP